MKSSNLSLLIAILLSSCVPAAAVPTLTSIPTQTATLTATNTPKPTSTSTPTPKIYTLRIEFSTTSDWSNLSILDSSSIVDTRLVEKQGNFTSVSVDKTFLGVSQSLADAQALKEISITVDLDISENATNKPIQFLLQKGDLNDSDIRFYNVLNGTKYSLLDEVYRAGYVEPKTDLNPYNFSFDVKPLFQDVVAIATLTQSEARTGKFIFEYYNVAYGKTFPDLKGEVNIFISNWDGSSLTPITNGLDGINRIVGISPDGKVVLVASRSSFLGKSALYLINLNSESNASVKLTNEVDGQAVFLDNARIAYIGKGSQGHGIYVSNFDGTEQTKIGSPNGRSWTVVASDQSRVYWRTFQKENFKDSSGVLYMYGDFEGLWWTNINGSGQGKLESNGQQIISSQYAFSPDGKSIAWISAGLESGCSLLGGLAVWSPDIRNGNYTIQMSRPSMFINRNSPHLGKVIDTAYVEDYVRQCLVMHIASLSDMDNDTKIPLIPPFDPTNEDFFYHKAYSLTWSPDNSEILAYDGGGATGYLGGVTDYYPLALYEVSLRDTNPKLARLKVLSNSPMVQSGPHSMPHPEFNFTLFRFSPDGRLLLFAKHNPYANFYSADVYILNLETLNFSDDLGNNLTPETQDKRVGSVYWLP